MLLGINENNIVKLEKYILIDKEEHDKCLRVVLAKLSPEKVKWNKIKCKISSLK